MFVVGIKVYSQDFNKTILSKEDPDWLYTNDGESDTLFYLDLTPTLKSETILILMSGWHRKSEDIFKRTSLPDEAYHRGIPTIIPSLIAIDPFLIIPRLLISFLVLGLFGPFNVISSFAFLMMTSAVSMLFYQRVKRRT